MAVIKHEFIVCPDCGRPDAISANVDQLCDDMAHALGTEKVEYVRSDAYRGAVEALGMAREFAGNFIRYVADDEHLLAEQAWDVVRQVNAILPPRGQRKPDPLDAQLRKLKELNESLSARDKRIVSALRSIAWDRQRSDGTIEVNPDNNKEK